MLTIKAIYAPQREEIFEAKRVRTVPVDNSPHVNVIFEPSDAGGEMGICSQDCLVFVMNEKGHTISSYG